MSLNPLCTKVADLSGVGEKTADALAKSGIITVFDLLLRVPKAIVEEMDCPGFAHMEAGRTYVAKGTVIGVKISGSSFKQRLEAVVQDDSGRMSVVFFGPAVRYAQKILQNDACVTFTGEAKDFLGRIQMVHPKMVAGQNYEVVPMSQANYSQVAGISPPVFRRLVQKATAMLKGIGIMEHLEPKNLDEANLATLAEAVFHIHEPSGDSPQTWDRRGENHYFRRLAFEELLSFYLRMFLSRKTQNKTNAYCIEPAELACITQDFLPFRLTGAQSRVCQEIIHDLSLKKPMTRLIQGDVGCGKTAVSAVAARHVVNAGLQVGVLAPTEILAEQLAQVFQNFFKNTDVKVALITGSTKQSIRQELTKKLKSHEIHIAIGTHALLSDDVCFNQLGLLVIDEQHRFGVNQRSCIIADCEKLQGFAPHLMVMSATPIPRSLALTLYGDLDLSVIDERPPGRIAVATQILSGPVLNSLKTLCTRIIATKQKAFIVFPLVEESEHLDLENATKAHGLLQSEFGPSTCGLLHGRMKPVEKAHVMAAFKENHFSLLISTTVVEVGVDVPDATCMVIIHPERFGLAQLHQLRGRVGRKNLASYCFLLSDIQNKFGPSYQRLKAMCKTSNGFELAQIDLDLRGPGELLGTKQAGLPNFLIFNHTDFANIVQPAKSYAQTLAATGVNHHHAHLFWDKAAYFS